MDYERVKLLGWLVVFLLIFIFGLAGLVGYFLGWRAGVKAERWANENILHPPSPPVVPDPLAPKWDTL